jgi:hypothetical protein
MHAEDCVGAGVVMGREGLVSRRKRHSLIFEGAFRCALSSPTDFRMRSRTDRSNFEM